MKNIQKGSVNNIIFYPRNFVPSYTSPHYIFRLNNLVTNDDIIISGNNLSNSSSYYLFQIEEVPSISADTYASKIYIPNAGSHQLYVYENSGATLNLEISAGTLSLYNEQCWVYEDDSQNYYVTTADDLVTATPDIVCCIDGEGLAGRLAIWQTDNYLTYTLMEWTGTQLRVSGSINTDYYFSGDTPLETIIYNIASAVAATGATLPNIVDGINTYTATTIGGTSVNLVDSPSIYQLSMSGSLMNATDEKSYFSGNTDPFGYGKFIFEIDPAKGNLNLGVDDPFWGNQVDAYYFINCGLNNIITGFSLYSFNVGIQNFVEGAGGSIMYGGTNQAISQFSYSLIGGSNNTGNSLSSGVIFGASNFAKGTNYMLGGVLNYIGDGDGIFSFGSTSSSIITGFYNKITDSQYSWIGGGGNNIISSSTFTTSSAIVAGDGHLIHDKSYSSILAGQNLVMPANNTALAQNLQTTEWNNTQLNLTAGLPVDFANFSASIYSGFPASVISQFGVHGYNQNPFVVAQLNGIMLDTDDLIIGPTMEFRANQSLYATFGLNNTVNFIISSSNLGLNPNRYFYLQGYSNISTHPNAEISFGGGWIGTTVDTAYIKHTYVDNANGELTLGVHSNGERADAIHLDQNRNVGIGGILTPSARLHLTGGTDLPETAPLKFSTGAYLATPESGATEWNINVRQNLAFTPNSNRRWLAFEDESTIWTDSSYTATTDDKIILVAPTGSTTITLPTTTTNGISYIIKDAIGSALTYSISVVGIGGETFDGSSSASISTNFQSLTFISYNSNWYII